MSLFETLTGRKENHLTFFEGVWVHKKVVSELRLLKQNAKKKGFDLSLASGHRNFLRQSLIWNNKAQGKKTLLDDQGKILNFKELTPQEILFAILRWSALPGASRHHWGTDFDIYDKNSLPHPHYQIQLTPEEVADKGPMGKFHHWLDQLIDNNQSRGFFRPYKTDLKGVAPERWHLSFAPLAQDYFEKFDFNLFLKNIDQSDILLKELVLDHALEIYCQYTINITLP